MFWAISNLLLSIFEMLFIWAATFSFMKVNSRTVFLPKWYYAIAFAAVSVCYYIGAVFLPESWLTVLLQIIITAILGFLLFHRKPLPIILDILFSVVLILGMECGIFIFNIILHYTDLSVFPNMASVGSAAMILKLLIMIPLAIAMITWKKAHSEGTLTLRQTVTVLVLPVFSVFFLYSMIQMCMVYVQLHGLWLMAGNIIALLLLNIYFLYLFRYLFRVNKLEQEKKMADIQNELQYRHYEELERKYRESRKILHDMKNHLQAVEQLYEDKDRQAGDHYVKNLYHMINVMGEKYYSSNHMLNIILNEKLSQAQADGIKVTAEIGDANFDDLEDMDITTVFANLLDNAIESANSVDNGWLQIKIDTVQDFRVIQIRNARASAQEKRSDPAEDRARKQKEGSHMGLGLVNVRQALSKYHGSLEQSETENEYCINLIIPGKE